MERPRQSTVAISALAGGLYAYDYFCSNNEQITDRAHEWGERPIPRALLALGTIAIGLHLNSVYERLGVPHLDPMPYLIKTKEFGDE